MDLPAFREKYGRHAIPELARNSGLHAARLYEILNGHVPTVAIAKAIEAGSKGEVTAAEVLGISMPTVVTNAADASPARGAA